MNIRISVKTAVVCLMLMLTLSACSALTRSDEPAMTTWWLVPYTGAARLETNADNLPQLVLVHVSAIPGLDSDRILALTADAELKPYAGARWTDHIPELAASLIGRTLEASGRFELASVGSQGPAERCDLTLEVREFFAFTGASGQTDRVMVAMDGFYQCGSDAAVHIQLKRSVNVTDSRMKTVVAAYQRACDEVMKELLGQM